MGAHRQLIAAMTVALVGCSSSSSSSDEAIAPTMGRGTREDPPPGISPPSSGGTGSSGGFVQVEGCPSQRTDLPMSPLTRDDVRALVVGIYRSCESSDGLEIRVDEENGELHWYRLDDRFVRRPPPGFDGPFEIGACESDQCTVSLVEPDATNPATTTFRLSLWPQPEAPTLAMAFLAWDGKSTSQEWVRVAD